MSETGVNKQTKEALSMQLKSLKNNCVGAYNVIENSQDVGLLPNDTQNKVLNYVEALRTEIESRNTANITTDNNLLTSQFLSEIREKSEQVEELIAFTKGTVYDLDIEIERLKNLIAMSKEIISRPRVEKKDVEPQHMRNAKIKFRLMKQVLHGLIHSLYPNSDNAVKEVLDQLMQEMLNEESYGYIKVTSENYPTIELLRDINIVCSNPYNNMEVKLVF